MCVCFWQAQMGLAGILATASWSTHGLFVTPLRYDSDEGSWMNWAVKATSEAMMSPADAVTLTLRILKQKKARDSTLYITFTPTSGQWYSMKTFTSLSYLNTRKVLVPGMKGN